MVRLVIGIVIVGLLVQTGASEECSLGKEGNTIDFGKCKNGKGKLKVQGNDLNFKLLSNENGPGYIKTINVTIGACSLQCDFFGKTNEKARLYFGDLGRSFHFPVPFKLSADGYTIGEGSNAVHLPATCVYNPSQTGMVVEFDFTLKEKIPGLKLTFENAHAFNVTDEDPDWSVKSWRLWSTIGGGIVGIVIVGGLVVGTMYWCFSKCNIEKTARKIKVKASKKGPKGAAADPSATNQGGPKKKEPKEPKSLSVATAKPLIGNLRTKEAEADFFRELNKELQRYDDPPSEPFDLGLAPVAKPPVNAQAAQQPANAQAAQQPANAQAAQQPANAPQAQQPQANAPQAQPAQPANAPAAQPAANAPQAQQPQANAPQAQPAQQPANAQAAQQPQANAPQAQPAQPANAPAAQPAANAQAAQQPQANAAAKPEKPKKKRSVTI